MLILNFPRAALATDLRTEIQSLGKSFVGLATQQIRGWISGSELIPYFPSHAKETVDSWVLNSKSVEEADLDEQIAQTHPNAQQFFELTQQYIPLYSDLNRRLRQSIMNGKVQDMYNEITNDYIVHHCDLSSQFPCPRIRDEMFGLFIVFYRAPELVIQIGYGFPIERFEGAVLRQLFNANLGVEKNCLVQLLQYSVTGNAMYIQQFDYWMSKFNPTVHENDHPYTGQQPRPFKAINHWRLNTTIVDLGFSQTADRNEYYTRVAANKLLRMYPKVISDLQNLSASVKKSKKISVMEIYADLGLLQSYFNAHGAIPAALKIQRYQGELRSHNAELIPSPTERLLYRVTWGFFTDYGTSFYKIFLTWLGLIILTWIICAWLWQCAPSLNSKTAVGKSIKKGLNSAVLFWTLRDDPSLPSFSSVIILRGVSAVLVTLFLGYLISYLGRPF